MKCYISISEVEVLPVAGEKWFDGEETEDEKIETDELEYKCSNGEYC